MSILFLLVPSYRAKEGYPGYQLRPLRFWVTAQGEVSLKDMPLPSLIHYVVAENG